MIARKGDIAKDLPVTNKKVIVMSSDHFYDQAIDVDSIEQSAYFTTMPRNKPIANILPNSNSSIERPSELQDEYVN